MHRLPLSIIRRHIELHEHRLTIVHGAHLFLGWAADKLAGPAIAGILIALIGSWLLPLANERARARREHLAKTVDQLDKIIGQLRVLVVDYWSADADDTSFNIEAEIQFQLQLLSALMEVCVPSLLSRPQGTSLLANLAEQITSPDFEAVDRKANKARAQRSSLAAADLLASIIVELGRYHHRPFTPFIELPWAKGK